MTKKSRMWNGERWGLYNDGYWRIGGRYLHREKWEKLRGPIPKGYVVHHKNHDRSDCRIANLMCLSRGDHSKHHISDNFHNPEAIAKATATRLKNAVKRGRAISAARLAMPRLRHVCVQCRKIFMTRSVIAQLCSTRCRSNNRYQTRGRKRVGEA